MSVFKRFASADTSFFSYRLTGSTISCLGLCIYSSFYLGSYARGVVVYVLVYKITHRHECVNPSVNYGLLFTWTIGIFSNVLSFFCGRKFSEFCLSWKFDLCWNYDLRIILWARICCNKILRVFLMFYRISINYLSIYCD